MITSQSFDLAAVRKEENRIYEHIGRFTVRAAMMDQMLTVLLDWMAGSADRGAAQSIFEGEQVSVKQRLLKRALPDQWADKKRLHAAVQMIQGYRNGLAHSVVAPIFAISEGTYAHYKRREQTGLVPEAIDLTELELWEHRASAVNLALTLLTKFFRHDRDICEADLRQMVLDFMERPDNDLRAALDYVLPDTSANPDR